MNIPNSQLKFRDKSPGKTLENEILEKATGDKQPKKSLERKLE